jgi:predicted nucleic-acid-binding protein
VRAVDTDVLGRLVTGDDPKQVAAETLVAGGAWVPHLVLAEALRVQGLVHELSHSRLATAVDMLLSHKDLTLQDSDVAAAALGQYRKKPSLTGSDGLVLESARKAGHLPLRTIDRQLGELEGAQRP